MSLASGLRPATLLAFSAQGLVVLPVLLSLVGPSPHDANIVMEDFYKDGAGGNDSSEENKEGRDEIQQWRN